MEIRDAFRVAALLFGSLDLRSERRHKVVEQKVLPRNFDAEKPVEEASADATALSAFHLSLTVQESAQSAPDIPHVF